MSPAFTSMADFPRWVDQWDVDSQAMLSAFIAYHVEVSEMLKVKHGMSFQPIWEGQLWSIIHEDPPALRGTVTATMPLKIPMLPCRREDCPRCGVRGGYMFRWYSPYWAAQYNKMRRAGSWEAPEPLYASQQAAQDHHAQHERFWLPSF